jgi:hypothetical protein
MLFFILYNSMSYVDVKSPISSDWAFLWILHVPRSIFDRCSTGLISSIEQLACITTSSCIINTVTFI